MTPATATAPRERNGYTDEEIALFAQRIVAAMDRPGGLDALCKRFKISLADRIPFAPAQEVAALAVESLMRGKAIVVPGFINKLGVWSTRFTPRWLLLRIVALAFKPV